MEGKARANIVQLVSYLLVTQQNITTKLTFRFSNEIQSSEARCFFGFQQMQENIHLEVFGLLTEILTQRQEEYRNDTIEMVSASNFLTKKWTVYHKKWHGLRDIWWTTMIHLLNGLCHI